MYEPYDEWWDNRRSSERVDETERRLVRDGVRE